MCITPFGDTPEEVLKEVLIAKAMWLEVVQAEGKAIPSPRYKPQFYQAAS